DRDAAAEQLDVLLRQKIAMIDQVCGLTDTQKAKLRLAGQGDAARLFDRVDGIASQVRAVEDDPVKVYQLLSVGNLLQRDCVRPGFCCDGWLFFKSLQRLLTSDQTTRLAPLQALVRAGGLVRIRRGISGEMLEASLTGEAPVDDLLEPFAKLPGLGAL